jgi:Fur family peroxide stress response transcriptional regulator
LKRSPTIRRNSRQRSAILEIVRSMKNHPNAEEIYEIARLTMPNVSLGTIYRNLKLLSEEKKIKEIQFEPGKTRFDGMTNEHEHFICTNCNRIIDINPTPTVKYLASTNPEVRELTVQSYFLTYYGLCKECGPYRI